MLEIRGDRIRSLIYHKSKKFRSTTQYQNDDVDNYVFLDRLSWNNFNESQDFIEQVESYYKQTGYYPKSVHVDKIYRTRKNRAYCKDKGIRINGMEE